MKFMLMYMMLLFVLFFLIVLGPILAKKLFHKSIVEVTGDLAKKEVFDTEYERCDK